MATLTDRIRTVSDLSQAQAEHLRSLCSSWQVLADLSFSDLLLYIPVRGEDAFHIVAQLRPFTSQTLYAHDMVGTRITQPEQPVVERALREGRIWAQDDPVLVDGVPLRMEAVPVRHRGEVVGVVTKEGSPAISRRPGRLESAYLDAAQVVSQMICDGVFPYPDVPEGEWPRVGDGLCVVDGAGRIKWASPNALSSLRRLGVKHNVVGSTLDALGLGDTPVERSLRDGRLLDGELARGDGFVAMRVVPLTSDDDVQGALVLSRDVTELRRKERVISAKDAMIREVHHRVKNNLQTIASLLRLQGRRLTSKEAKDALDESVLRIGSIALVHETLSEQSSDVTEFGEVARRIAQMVVEGLVSPDRRVDIRVAGETRPIGAGIATPLAVTVTELLQNAVEHAFPDGRRGMIDVELGRDGTDVRVVVADDGVGMEGSPENSSRLGLQIVRALVGELGGSVRFSSERGTRVEVRIPDVLTPSTLGR